MLCIGGNGKKLMLAGIDEQMLSFALKDHCGRASGPQARTDPAGQAGEEACPGGESVRRGAAAVCGGAVMVKDDGIGHHPDCTYPAAERGVPLRVDVPPALIHGLVRIEQKMLPAFPDGVAGG